MIRFKQAYARKALPFLTGAIVVSTFASLQNLFVTGVPFHLRNYLVPVLIGGMGGFLLGKAYFKLRESEVRMKTILDSVQSGIIVVDAETHAITEINKLALQMIGATRDNVIGSVCHEFICTASSGECPITDKGQVIDNSERVLLTINGEQVPILKTVSSVYLNGRKHLLESFIDITELKQAEHKIRQLAFYDSLTSLPNRILLMERLRFVLAHAQRNKHLVGVMFIDLDRFKEINDTLGHSHGDQLLQIVSERLLISVRETDIVARLGGDEFVIIFDIVYDEIMTTIAQKILQNLAKPIPLGEQEVVNTCSIGIALYPMDGKDEDTLLKNADIAMYEAKQKGRNNYQFFSANMNDKTMARLVMESSIRRGLERGEFFLHYQPQIDLKSGSIIGFEALLRWHHPELGLIPPGKFIPVAEESGLIIQLGELVLRMACVQNKTWQNAALSPVKIAVNLSIRQFQQLKLLSNIEEILQETGLDPQYLELEITESCIMENADENIKILRMLKGLGIHLSIDDFGTGYSSLSYLKILPIDRIKIAQSFVRDIITDPDDAAIAQAIIGMAHSMKLKVIAEGVETKEQLDFLCLHACDEVQGYYFAKPMLAEGIADFMKDWPQRIAQSRSLPCEKSSAVFNDFLAE